MTSVSHSELIDDQLHVAFRWVQEGDPGGGADHPGHYWLKLSTGALKRRKDDDSGWDDVGGTAGALTGTLFTTKGDLLTATGSNAPVRKGAGTDGYFLRPKASNSDGLEWYDHEGASDPHPQYTTNAEATTIADTEAAAAVSTHVGLSDPHSQYLKKATLTAKGDLYVATASGVVTRLPIDTDGKVLTADSGATPGVSWQTPSGGGGGASIDSSAYGSLPAAGNAGNLYLPNDAPVLLRDDGAAWQAFGPIHHLDLSAKPTTWFNQNTNTITSRDWGDFMYCPDTGGTGSISIRGREKAYPTPPFTLDIALQFVGYARNYTQFGLMTRDSGSGRIVTFGPSVASLYILRYDSATAINGIEEQAELPMMAGSPMYLRIVDGGTNIQYWWSVNGEDWINFRTTLSRTFWLASPDKIGFFVNNQTNFFPVGVTLLSWYEH
jgi:hypothetical protein